jgi:hypothetical protein
MSTNPKSDYNKMKENTSQYFYGNKQFRFGISMATVGKW